MQCTNAAGNKPKSWPKLLEAAVTAINTKEARKAEILRLIKSGDYLTACQVIRDAMGHHTFHTFLTHELLTPNYAPAPIHDTIIQLGSRIYATPNFDKIFENRAAALPNPPFLVKNYCDADVAAISKGSISAILKVHGTIDAPDRMIFTRTDYTMARNEFWRFYAVIESLSLTHTFLFIGCGLNDPDIKLIPEDHAFTHKWASPHYFVLEKRQYPASIIPAIQNNLNIVILEYDGGHGQLKPELDVLVLEINRRRAQIQLICLGEIHAELPRRTCISGVAAK